MTDRKRPKMVLVMWVDSCGSTGWRSSEESYSLARCETVGYLISSDREKLTVALTRGINPDIRPWSDVMTIPRVCVRQVKRLRT